MTSRSGAAGSPGAAAATRGAHGAAGPSATGPRESRSRPIPGGPGCTRLQVADRRSEGHRFQLLRATRKRAVLSEPHRGCLPGRDRVARGPRPARASHSGRPWLSMPPRNAPRQARVVRLMLNLPCPATTLHLGGTRVPRQQPHGLAHRDRSPQFAGVVRRQPRVNECAKSSETQHSTMFTARPPSDVSL